MHLTEYKYLVLKSVINTAYDRYFAGALFYRAHDANYYEIKCGKVTSTIFDDMIKRDATGNLCKKIA